MSHDETRYRKVYKELFHLSGIREGDTISEAEIVRIWGQRKNRAFVRRVLINIYPDRFQSKAAQGASLPALSLNRLVDILTAINDYWLSEHTASSTKADERLIPPFIGVEEKAKAIKNYSELSRAEKESLGLATDFESYIADNLDKPKMLLPQATHYQSIEGTSKYHSDNDGRKVINAKYIETLIERVAQKELPFPFSGKAEVIEKIKKEVSNEIKVIELQSGLQSVVHARSLLEENEYSLFDKSIVQKWEKTLPDEVIEQITRFYIANVKVIEDLPIHFKFIEVDRVSTSPLFVRSTDRPTGLLNPDIWDDKDVISEEANEFIDAFDERFVYRVRVHFCIKLNPSKVTHKRLIEVYGSDLDTNQKNELHFFEEVSGASSIISLVRKALNRALLWDLPVLKEYFPIAQEVYVDPEGKLYGNDTLSTVWSTSRVRIVQLKDVEYLLSIGEDRSNAKKISDFRSYIEGSNICQGDHVCFDMVEAISASGFHARLKLIQEMGIDCNNYLSQICERVIALKNSIKGKNYLWSYPFSLKVMENYLKKTLLEGYLTSSNERREFRENDVRPWSNLAYDAHLSITQAYLEEGLTEVADHMLHEIEPHIPYLSHLNHSTYLINKARHTFLSVGEGREHAISKCDSLLASAGEELKKRSMKFYRIGEFSQANLSPSFSHWARIYALRARISFYFPLFVRESTNDLTSSIRLLEKSRISAARDGNAYYYAKVTLYQSWCYLMQAYIGKRQEKTSSAKDCIEWARRLIDHALICYSKTSETAYQDYLKDVLSYKSSSDEEAHKQERIEKFGGVSIPSPPLIHLVFNMEDSEADKGKSSKNKQIIDIDSFLVKIQCESARKVVDLFGQHSAIYFFSRGMLKLCDDRPNRSDEEFTKDIRAAHKLFTCCWAVSEGGAVAKKMTQSSTGEKCQQVGRTFEQLPSDDYNVSRIRGLYLHRISELVDMSKIFTVICKYILSRYYSDYQGEWDDIVTRTLDKEGIFSRVEKSDLTYAKNQSEYNRHLQKHFQNIFQYLMSCEQKEFQSIQSCRDEIVRSVFLRLRGD